MSKIQIIGYKKYLKMTVLFEGGGGVMFTIVFIV